MKFGGIHDGTIYCTRGLEVGTWDADAGFDPRGRLPNPSDGVDGVCFDVLGRQITKQTLQYVTGTPTTANVWPLGDGRLLATSGRWVFASDDDGRSWDAVHELPRSSGPMGVLPTSVCQYDGDIYLAEYSLGDEAARILVSEDRGQTWTTWVVRSEFRHFHGLFPDPYTGQLWGTTGDTDAESAVGIFEHDEFVPVGRDSQLWRAVGLTFTPEYVLWGMDCSFEETVAILRLARDDMGNDPRPEIVGTTDCSPFYPTTLSDGDETWVVVSTAAETGIDTTAPPGRKRNRSGRAARVLAASSASSYERWHELFRFERRETLGDHVGPIPTCGAYVFLGFDPTTGLVVNPYNVSERHGDIITLSTAARSAAVDRSTEVSRRA
ncbi:glycosyl hydrolase [Halostella sp. PRR32]|uniref:glycosyl hydrolase n=1 Tax=Halostella sp. PRR32 TaxID=3098147 RepID=UPI002B1D8CEF|nr:glycosyl hydrolase [Halostella sp. PRR32]